VQLGVDVHDDARLVLAPAPREVLGRAREALEQRRRDERGRFGGRRASGCGGERGESEGREPSSERRRRHPPDPHAGGA
jgi:hypothetical protein